MSPSEQTPSWRIRGKNRGSSAQVPFPESASLLPGTARSSDWCSCRNRCAHLQGQSQVHWGRRGRTVVIMGQGTRVPSVSHTEPTFFPAPDLSSRGSRGTLTSRESEASALSLWLLAHRSCPYTGLWGSGKRPGGLPQARGLDSRADKRLAQSSHRWALLSAGT